MNDKKLIRYFVSFAVKTATYDSTRFSWTVVSYEEPLDSPGTLMELQKHLLGECRRASDWRRNAEEVSIISFQELPN